MGVPSLDASDEQKGAMVYVSNECDEDWQRRLETRRAAVATIKATNEYQAFDRNRQPTPDPSNRKLSKRQWEDQMSQWRVAIRS